MFFKNFYLYQVSSWCKTDAGEWELKLGCHQRKVISSPTVSIKFESSCIMCLIYIQYRLTIILPSTVNPLQSLNPSCQHLSGPCLVNGSPQTRPSCTRHRDLSSVTTSSSGISAWRCFWEPGKKKKLPLKWGEKNPQKTMLVISWPFQFEGKTTGHRASSRRPAGTLWRDLGVHIILCLTSCSTSWSGPW